MRIIACLFIWLLIGLLPALAENAPITVPLFGDFHFGDVPRDDMLCVAGHCATGQIAVGHRNPGQLVSVYQLPVSESQLGGVAISTPQFSFFQNRLLRIGFYLDCEPDTAELCMAALAETFNGRYGMTLIRETYSSLSAQEASLVQHYLTASGAKVEIRRLMHDRVWSRPYVNFNDPALSDVLRLAANPKYRPHVD